MRTAEIEYIAVKHGMMFICLLCNYAVKYCRKVNTVRERIFCLL